jgi:hypothetical protein
MYRFSRALFLEIKDLVDPHPETITAPEAKRYVLHCCEATIERLARDPRFDGRFFICVLSTGIYCRAICPSKHGRPLKGSPAEGSAGPPSVNGATWELGGYPCCWRRVCSTSRRSQFTPISTCRKRRARPVAEGKRAAPISRH